MFESIILERSKIKEVLYRGSLSWIGEIAFCFESGKSICIGIDSGYDEVIERDGFVHGKKYKKLPQNNIVGCMINDYRKVYNSNNYFDGFQITLCNEELNENYMIKFNVVASSFWIHKFVRIL